MIELRLHTVTYSETDDNGFIGIQFDAFGEQASGMPTVETHHPHGFRARPRDPDGEFGSNVLVGIEGSEIHALAVLADPRWVKNLPKEKQGGSTQYGVTKNGVSALSFAQFDGDSGGWTLYVPEFSDSDVSGAYCVTVDPTQRTIQLIHPDGFAVVIDKHGITLRGDASTWLKLGAGVFEVNAAKCTIRGAVGLGAQPEAGMPLMPGVATQPTPSVFFSPT